MTFPQRPHERIRPPVPPVSPPPAHHITPSIHVEHPYASTDPTADFAPPSDTPPPLTDITKFRLRSARPPALESLGAGDRSSSSQEPVIAQPVVLQAHEAASGSDPKDEPTAHRHLPEQPEAPAEQPSTDLSVHPLGSVALGRVTEHVERDDHPKASDLSIAAQPHETAASEAPNTDTTEKYAGADLVAQLPPHPARLDPQSPEVRDDSIPLTTVVLADHTAGNAPAIARAIRNKCNILALETVIYNRDAAAMRALSQTLTDYVSSDPTRSQQAKDVLGGLPEFTQAMVDRFKGSDVQVELIDVPTLGSEIGLEAQTILESQEYIGALFYDYPHIPCDIVMSAIEDHTRLIAENIPHRDLNFAERLDALRQQHPDQNIAFVGGYRHYQLVSALADSHRHTIVTPTPDAPTACDEQLLEAYQQDPNQPLPMDILQRAIICGMYESISTHPLGDHLLPAEDLGIGDSTIPDDISSWRPMAQLQLLVKDLTDQEVAAVFDKLENAKRENSKHIAIVNMAAVFQELLEAKRPGYDPYRNMR